MKATKLIKKMLNLLGFMDKTALYKIRYRIIEIINEEDEYKVHVQLINSIRTFVMKPEEILADDSFVILFSPLDVRTLTYLGYLGINGPKYKILAQRIAEQGDIVFVIKQKGKGDVILKTSKEIVKNIELLKNMSSSDVASVAYNELQNK